MVTFCQLADPIQVTEEMVNCVIAQCAQYGLEIRWISGFFLARVKPITQMFCDVMRVHNLNWS